jgi:Rhomboid family
VFWVATGVAGVIASYLTLQPRLAGGPLGSFVFKASDFPSAGASGALFGLVGVLFVFGIKFRRELPEGFRRAFGTGLLPVILINLAIGYMLRGFIDNAAHLGGLFSGAALALVVDYKRPGERAAITFTWRALQVLALALIAISFFLAARHMRNAGPLVATLAPSTTESDSAENAYKDALNKGAEAVSNALNRQANQEMLTGAQQALDRVVGPDQQSELLRNELKALIVRAQEDVATTPTTAPSRKATEHRKKLFEDFDAWIKRRDEWVAGPGAAFGMRLVNKSEENSASPAMPAAPDERGSPK